jgi:phenolic acid decarboxylase
MQGHFVLHLAFFFSIFVVKAPLEEKLVCDVTERIDLLKYNEEFVEIYTENGVQLMSVEIGGILVLQ